MSEQKRTLDTIRTEYSQICSQAGHIQYQIATLSKDLELLNSQLRDLNMEATKLSKEQVEAPKAVEEVKSDV